MSIRAEGIAKTLDSPLRIALIVDGETHVLTIAEAKRIAKDLFGLCFLAANNFPPEDKARCRKPTNQHTSTSTES
jgi:hypothetical protein